MNNKNNFAFLYINSSYSNIFITVKNHNKNILFCFSGGQAFGKKVNVNKKNKLSPEILSILAEKVRNRLDLLSISSIEVISKISVRYYVNFFINKLFSKGLRITTLTIKLPYVHNGVRSRKLKRK